MHPSPELIHPPLTETRPSIHPAKEPSFPQAITAKHMCGIAMQQSILTTDRVILACTIISQPSLHKLRSRHRCGDPAAGEFTLQGPSSRRRPCIIHVLHQVRRFLSQARGAPLVVGLVARVINVWIASVCL
jgi:hypothetical protein